MERIEARAALLDMDGTLVDSTAVVERLWGEWAARHEVPRDSVLSVIHGRQGHESMAILLPERSADENLAENAGMLAREAVETDGVVEIAGAAAFVDALAPFPHAVVTSADAPLLHARMGAAGVRVPELAVTAESVSASKPDPEGFLLAAERLGVAPADCVVFEDSSVGIAAARAAGMRVVGVGAAAARYAPDAHVADLTAVRIAPSGAGFALEIG
ncbi:MULTISPECIES: HAD-IA family hydrolase [unclassified Leucobacter]|uniref:HAD-IA family hydrolase n=1 Tax=unclassified Leucobacter TaxID=2621730 RepID=UPI0006211ED0|nr:HAD-IA family hydrolase [Leucobacter sp. Ag1]KKI16742.1 HAD family hydrolase [Leucobacter sp. Ag1]